jgi:hypothetical protein
MEIGKEGRIDNLLKEGQARLVSGPQQGECMIVLDTSFGLLLKVWNSAKGRTIASELQSDASQRLAISHNKQDGWMRERSSCGLSAASAVGSGS